MMYATNIVTTVFQMGIIHNGVEGGGAPPRDMRNATSLTGRKKRTTVIAVELLV